MFILVYRPGHGLTERSGRDSMQALQELGRFAPAAALLIAAALFFIAAFRIWLAFERRRKSGGQAEHVPQAERVPQAAGGGAQPAVCPLCGASLARGEKLVSRIYRAASAQRAHGQRCLILGCPHCFSRSGADAPLTYRRRCPVCGKTVPADGALAARLFVRENGRNHVHISGCTGCVKGVRNMRLQT